MGGVVTRYRLETPNGRVAVGHVWTAHGYLDGIAGLNQLRAAAKDGPADYKVSVDVDHGVTVFIFLKGAQVTIEGDDDETDPLIVLRPPAVLR